MAVYIGQLCKKSIPVDTGLFFKSFFYIAVIYLKNIIM